MNEFEESHESEELEEENKSQETQDSKEAQTVESVDSTQESELTTLKISELTPFARRIEVKFVVIDKGEPRTILSKKTNEEHILADIKIGDESGIITMSLWDDTIDKVTEGQTYVAKSCYVNVFQNHMRLALGKYGTLEESEESLSLEEVNMDNDRSEEEHQVRRRRRVRPQGRRSRGPRNRDNNDFSSQRY
ncbi:MAG: single-stranded DNA-binding protein [Candidatus Hodarchaeales archaeon]